MNAVLPAWLPPSPSDVRLPLRPDLLSDLEFINRRVIYACLGLDDWQMACCEQAIDLVHAGTYPVNGRPTGAPNHHAPIRAGEETR